MNKKLISLPKIHAPLFNDNKHWENVACIAVLRWWWWWWGWWWWWRVKFVRKGKRINGINLHASEQSATNELKQV